MLEGLAAVNSEPRTVMIDAACLKAHRTAFNLRVRMGVWAASLMGHIKSGGKTKVYAVANANGRPLSFFMTAGQDSDYIGAAALLDDMSNTQ